MKYTKTILTAACLLQLGLYSCRKQEPLKQESAASTTATKFAEMKTPENFKWATNNVMNIQFQPIQNDTRKAVLKVVDASGRVYFKKLHSANESFSTNLEVPAHIQSLKVVFAGVQKDFTTSSSKVNLNLK